MHDDCKLLTRSEVRNIASSVHGIFKTMRLQKDITPDLGPDKLPMTSCQAIKLHN